MSRCEVAAAENSPACLVQEVVQRFGSTRIRVQGSSMLPSIRPGDEIEVQPIHFHEIETGEVIAYRRGDRLFAHRVIETDSAGRLLTRGDAMPQADAPISKSEFLGIVTRLNRGGKVVGLRRSIADRTAAAIFRRSQLCAALFVRFTGLRG